MSNRIKVYALAAIAAGSFFATAPDAASAQGKSQDKGKSKSVAQARTGHDDHQDKKDKDKDRYKGNANGKDKNGPAFCRSGAGHPTHGRSWCVEKGFGLGSARWDNTDLGRVVFGGTSRTGNVGARTLPEVLGSVIFGRLQNQYGSTPLTGRWVSTSGGPLLLQVQSGSRPVAEFVDRNRDGRADVVLLNVTR